MSFGNIFNVRDHSQEREWLRNLGDGNIFDGVQQLIKQAADEGKLEYDAPGDKKSKKERK